MVSQKNAVNVSTPTSKSKRSQTSGSAHSKGASSSGPANTQDIELIVRPSSSDIGSSMKVYMSTEVLQKMGLSAGGLIIVHKAGFKGSLGVVTPNGSSSSGDVVQLSTPFRRLSGILLGDRVRILRYSRRPEEAFTVTLGCTSEITTEFEQRAAQVLRAMSLLSPGLRFEVKVGDSMRSVLVTEVQTLPMESLNLESDASVKELLSATCFITASTAIKFSTSLTISGRTIPGHVDFSSLGGMSKPIEILKSKIELPLHHPEYFQRFSMQPDRGFLLYGPPGTGKTMLLKAVAYETNAHVLTINGPSIVSKYLGETESALRGIFQEAIQFEPSIIFIDEIDALVPRRDGDDSGEAESRVVSTLLTLMDGMGVSGHLAVIGATNRPNSIDPALRRPGRFGQEIEIGIPDAQGRHEILKIQFANMPHDLEEADILEVANKTHGYVGADIHSLCREAVLSAIQRGLQQGSAIDEMQITKADLSKAMLEVRPSAMREIVLETPKVYWDDIGGLEVVKQKLKETVEWPLLHADSFTRLGVSCPRGVLLYGPPGCSKTLIAKALATEAELNFLAVKGPELFNKYVGESERAVREIFRKARAAAPSIIFFDEIDAISAIRGHGEAGGDRVLTSLLNEMDGIEALNDVMILAATNLPDQIDSALMRPGRLDRLVYVGPPDLQSRQKILEIQFRKMRIAPDVNAAELAQATEGCSGAEVVSLCQEAGIQAMNENVNINSIRKDHFDIALTSLRRSISSEVLTYFGEFARLNGGTV